MHPPQPTVPIYEYSWADGSDPTKSDEIQDFFCSEAIHQLKVRLCEVGRRLWTREYTDGNGGNLTIRVGDNLVLCTPTLICKGFMQPEDMCLVDLDGNQLAGTCKRTSEVLTHLGVMRAQAGAKACCHAHPPFATAYAVAGLRPPRFLTPEAEVFLGEIGLSEYRTPGTDQNGEVVGKVARDHPAVLMINHGVMTWAKEIEHAYWRMENTETYCKTVWIASHLREDLPAISGKNADDLIQIRQSIEL